MSDTMRVTKNDYGIDLTFNLKDKDGTALSLATASSVKLNVGRYGESSNLVTDASMTISSPSTSGIVTYTIASGSFDIDGYYDAEIQINYASGRRTVRSFTLQILEEL